MMSVESRSDKKNELVCNDEWRYIFFIFFFFVVVRLSSLIFFPRCRPIEKLPEFIVHVFNWCVCDRRYSMETWPWWCSKERKELVHTLFFVRIKAFAFWCLSLFSLPPCWGRAFNRLLLLLLLIFFRMWVKREKREKNAKHRMCSLVRVCVQKMMLPSRQESVGKRKSEREREEKEWIMEN